MKLSTTLEAPEPRPKALQGKIELRAFLEEAWGF